MAEKGVRRPATQLQSLHDHAHGSSWGRGGFVLVDRFRRRDGKAKDYCQRDPRKRRAHCRGRDVPLRHAPQGSRDVIDEESNADRQHGTEMPHLFHIPDPEHPDHSNKSHNVKGEMPAREFFAVKLGFERDRHQLIHRPHDDRANPAQHKQVGRSDDILVVVVGGEDAGLDHEPGYACAEREQTGHAEHQR